VPFVHQRGNHFDHPRNVARLGGGGEMVRALDAERIEVLEEGILERLRELGKRQAGGAAATDGFVVHIRQVHHPEHPQSAVFQVPLQEVLEDIRAEIPDVREIVNGRSASVEPHQARLARREPLDRTGEGVEKTQRHGRAR